MLIKKKIFNSKLFYSPKAFTLIELLIVIAVLGILAAAIITAINPVKRINQAKDSTVKSDMSQIVNALQAYFVGQNPPVYPPALEDLLTSNDLKTIPNQQAGYTSCAQGGVGTRYCYQKNPSGTEAPVVLWGYLFETTGKFHCWDSTNAVFKTSSSQPAASVYTCP